MEVLQLIATQFIRPMSTGRNRPLLLGCENIAGDKLEVVVKFRGREMDGKAQTAEVVAAQLADDLGLQVPRAAVVEIPPGFEAAIRDRDLARMVVGSPGRNFGSVHLGTGFTTWPPGREPYGAQRDQAADVFAFDTLAQNPDRRAGTPNLWVRSDCIGVYDHEQAFSFLSVPIIGGAPRPWLAASQGNGFRFLEQHIFYRSLRGGRLNLGPFEAKLGALSDSRIRAYAESVPSEWGTQDELCARVAEYLGEARAQREDLVSFIKHVLR